MKITFLGLSSFLIENKAGQRILIDPYDDSPKYTFGLNFPKKIAGKRLTADITLISHMDSDHASVLDDISIEPLKNRKYVANQYRTDFSKLNLRGVVVFEWNGFPNIAWSYNIDGFRLFHLADNVPVLDAKQIKATGKIDILFISPSKKLNDNKNVLANIKKLKPQYVVWAHHIPVGKQTEPQNVKQFFEELILPQKQAIAANPFTVGVFCNFWQNILNLNQKFQYITLIDKPTFILENKHAGKEPMILFFRTCLAKRK